jgi:hypothetical protein
MIDKIDIGIKEKTEIKNKTDEESGQNKTEPINIHQIEIVGSDAEMPKN